MSHSVVPSLSDVAVVPVAGANSEVLRPGPGVETAERLHGQQGHGPVHEWEPPGQEGVLPVLLHHRTHK